MSSTSELAGLQLGQLDLQRYEVLLLGAVREGQGTELLLRTNNADYVLKTGDVLVVIGAWQHIMRLRAATGADPAASSTAPRVQG